MTRVGERGGAALILALAVLAMSSSAVFQVHRTVVREWAMEGEALLGTRAALAADSALAWFLGSWTPPRPEWEGFLPDTVIAVPGAVLPAPPDQDGEVRVRFLGPAPGDPAADVWKLTIRARVRVPGKGSRPFRQEREAFVVTSREAMGAAPVMRAWRIVR